MSDFKMFVKKKLFDRYGIYFCMIKLNDNKPHHIIIIAYRKKTFLVQLLLK